MLKTVPNRIFYLILFSSLSFEGYTQDKLVDLNEGTQNNLTLDMIDLTPEQLLKEQKVLELQLSNRGLTKGKVYQPDVRLADLIGNYQIQFKSEIAKIYSQNNYLLLWENKLATKTFLKEYATTVASGISKKSEKHLAQIDKLSSIGGLAYDILLTDAFLDYLYYTKNIKDFAQQWLYSSSGYISKLPLENDISLWLASVKNGQFLSFINNLSINNSIYTQTLRKLSEISHGELTPELIFKLNKLALNLQRLRVIPNFQNGIFVNIPTYHLDYYRNGKLILNSRVIVGKETRRTPVMYSQLSNIVINPPWTPTPKLIKEDIVPKIKRDPSYAINHNYTLKDSDGNIVDPFLINWDEIKGHFPFQVKQAAGGSALGNYKFNMPSSDAIYLHDTPNHSLFHRKKRALSSGCVRIEKSDQLATILLKESGWTETRKNTVLKSKKTVSTNINSINPVYLYYVTYWVENNEIKTAPDIYGYDKLLDANNINWVLVQKYLN